MDVSQHASMARAVVALSMQSGSLSVRESQHCQVLEITVA